MTAEERRALNAFVARLRAHYGARLHDVLLFGSRARGDASPESDADVAVILDDGDWSGASEVMVMADMAYDALISCGLFIQPVPIARSAWDAPQQQRNRYFLEAVRQDARTLPVAA